MHDLPPFLEGNCNAKITGRNVARPVCGIVLAVLVILFLPLLVHKSKHPWIFGLYSRSYCAIILLHFAAIGLTLFAFTREKQRWIDGLHLVKTFGFGFWFSIWVLLIISEFCVYWVTGDTDFRNLGFAFVACGACVWWAIAYFARYLSRPMTNLALACTAALLALLVGELFLALFPIVSNRIETLREQKTKLYQFERISHWGREWYQSILTTDPQLGYKQRPNFVTTRIRPTDHAKFEIRTDAWGFFNPDCDSSEPYDVACVGDSFAAVPWSAILQDKTGLRVASFGVPAYSPPQYTIVVRRYAVKLKPKVLLYCLYVNDAVESVGYEEWKKSGMDWFTFKGAAWFGFRSPHTGRLLVKEYLLRVSRIYTLLDFATFRPTDELMPITAHPISYKTEKLNIVFDRASFTVLTDMKSDVVKRGINIIRDNLEQASGFCQESNVRMIVLLLPPKELVHYAALKERAKPDDPIENLPEFYRVLRKTCEGLHLECYDLTDRFADEAARTEKAFYRDVDIHWDDDGLNLMAEIVADILAASGAFGSKLK